MAITLEGTSVKYTISTPSAFTINEANIDQNVSAVFVPTVTRNKTGSAVTRYIVFSVGQNTDSYNIACYRAVFTASGKTATVTAMNSLVSSEKMGGLANTTFNRLYVGISTSTALSYFDSGYVSITKKINLYPTITLTPTYTQTSPNMSTFGRIIGICRARVQATIKNSWSYSGGSVTVALTSSSISGGGKTVSGTTQSTLTLDLGAMASTEIAVTASSKNAQGLTGSATLTLTCDEYTPPDIVSEKAVRSSGNERDAVLTIDYKLDAINQRGTTGAITVAYQIKSGSTTVKSGTATICAAGTALVNLTGTVTINVTGSVLNPDTNYSLSMTITDRVTSGNAKTDIITSTFRLLHINSNGKGIGIGGAAPDRGLKVYDNIEADSFNGVAPVFGSYPYSGTGTSSISFTDTDCIGKSHIICTGQPANAQSWEPIVNFADINSNTGEITVDLNESIAAGIINYICW